MSDSLNLVLFSGTADKLHAAATFAAGAAAMDRPVNILVQYWALDAFRKERIEQNLGLAWDSTVVGTTRPVHGTRAINWLESLRLAKELGEVRVYACSGSMETLGIPMTELDPIIDTEGGIATFLMAAEDGQIVFI